MRACRLASVGEVRQVGKRRAVAPASCPPYGICLPLLLFLLFCRCSTLITKKLLLLQGHILMKLPLPDEPSQWLVMSFLCGDMLFWAWHSGDAQREFEQIYIDARRSIWFRIFLGGPMKCTSEATGEPIGEPSACYSEAPSSFSVVRRFLAQVPRPCGWLLLLHYRTCPKCHARAFCFCYYRTCMLL